jgi:hypothetical protein
MAEKRKWSAPVTRHSNALDLQKDIFKSNNPEAITQSLKRSAEQSRRWKAAPFRSALSMLTFYICRRGTKPLLQVDESTGWNSLRVRFANMTKGLVAYPTRCFG